MVLVFVPGRLAARESKVAKSDTTVTVNKEVTRFEVSMQQVCGMDEIESAQGVIQHGHDMIFFQDCAADLWSTRGKDFH